MLPSAQQRSVAGRSAAETASATKRKAKLQQAVRPPFFLQRFPFSHCLRQKYQRNTSQRDGITHSHRYCMFHCFPVDQRAPLGPKVIQCPVLLPIPAQRRMLSGNTGIIQANILDFTASNDILPMCQQYRRSIRQTQLPPNFRCVRDFQQRPNCPI